MASFTEFKSIVASRRPACLLAVCGLILGIWGFWYTLKNDTVEKVIKTAEEHDPKEVEFQQGLLKLVDLVNNKFYEGSEDLASRLLEVHPHHSQVLSMLALAQHKLGKLDKAEKNLKLSIQFEPGEWVLHHNLGNVLFDMGKAEEALLSYGKALELSPDNPKILLSHARSLEKLGRYSEACDFYHKATELSSIDASLRVIIKNRVKKLDVLAYLEKEKR